MQVGLFGLISGAGKLIEGFGDAKALRYQAAVAERNATIADINANEATFQSQQEAQHQDMIAGQELGQLIAAAGASGFATNSVSTVRTVQDTSGLATRDRGFIRHQGNVQSTSFRQQAQDYRTDAAMNRASAGNAVLGAFVNAGSSLISGAASVNRRTAISIRAGGTT